MNAKTSRRLSPALFSSKTLFASLPLALAALVAQGCGDGLDKVESDPNESGTAATSSAPSSTTGSSSSATDATSSGQSTGSAETGSGSGSSEPGPGEETTGSTTGAESTTSTTGAETKTDETKTDETKTDETKTDETKTDETKTDDSSSSDSTSSDSTSSDSTDSTEEEGPAPDEKGDDKVKLEWYETGVDAQLIGLNAPSKDTVWAGGTDGALLKTTDGGKTWKRILVSDDAADAKLEFRDIEVQKGLGVFRNIYALAAGEGGASRIYFSRDGGRSWTQQFKAEEEKAFINCMAFGDRTQGFVYGDAIDKEHYILTTGNGMTWERVKADKLPEAQESEGGFSASGTCAIATDKSTYMVATAGAKKPRILKSTDRGQNWKAYDVPLATGENYRGLSSLVMWSKDEGLVFAADVRGDEKAEKVQEAVAYTKDGGETWEKRDFVGPKRGFFGGASNKDGSFIIGVGPAGMHYSTDKGVTWTEVSRKNLWSVTFADDKTAFAAGANGTIARITLK